MQWNRTHLTSVGNQVITAKGAILHKILIGLDIANGRIEVADHRTDGDDSDGLVDNISGDTLMTSNAGERKYDIVCKEGITVDLTIQTQVTILWKPREFASIPG